MCRVFAFIILCSNLWGQSRADAVLAAERAWLEGYNRRDALAIAMLEDDGFIITFGDGHSEDKAAQLASVRNPLPADARYAIETEGTQVRMFGKVAVLTGTVTESGTAAGRSFAQRSRYTDTWLFRNGRWRVIASHLSDVK